MRNWAARTQNQSQAVFVLKPLYGDADAVARLLMHMEMRRPLTNADYEALGGCCPNASIILEKARAGEFKRLRLGEVPIPDQATEVALVAPAMPVLSSGELVFNAGFRRDLTLLIGRANGMSYGQAKQFAASRGSSIKIADYVPVIRDRLARYGVETFIEPGSEYDRTRVHISKGQSRVNFKKIVNNDWRATRCLTDA